MSKHVVVIGGGVIGLSVAEACVRRGLQVTLIEGQPQQRTGCSFGNAGMIVPSHFIPLAAPGMVALGLKWMWNPESPFYIKPRLDLDLIRWGLRFMRSATRAHVERAAPLLRDLNYASRDLYLRLAETERFGLVTKGLLMLCKEASALEEEAEVVAKAHELGIPAELLDNRSTAQRDPAVTMDVAGSVYFPDDCHLSPERLLALLERRLRDREVKMLWETSVAGWRTEGGRIRAAKIGRAEIEADEFIVCGGFWSSRMIQSLGLRLPMQAGKGYSVTLQDPVELPGLCSILAEARVAVTPMSGALRFGGTMEMAGSSSTISRRRVEGIIRAATRYFPHFRREHFDGVEPWHGLRPCSPDGLPYLGRTAAADNLIIATGHAMMGLSLAPITGEIVARLADGEPAGYDLALLAPDRFS